MRTMQGHALQAGTKDAAPAARPSATTTAATAATPAAANVAAEAGHGQAAHQATNQTADATRRFGDCEIHRDTRELWRGGQRQPVRRQVFDLMLHLIDQRPRVVPHHELARQVWQRGDVPRSLLARAVMEARRATGDTGHFVSVRAMGYRFASPLVDDASPPPPPPATAGVAAGGAALASALGLMQQAVALLATAGGEPADPRDDLARVRGRLAALEAENLALRQRCRALEAALADQGRGPAGLQPANRATRTTRIPRAA